MATGRNNKLVGQTGEYLVAAELSRMNLIATTFTGNVPHYDIIASDNRAGMLPFRSRPMVGFGGFATVCLGIVGFFLGAICLTVGLLVGRDKQKAG